MSYQTLYILRFCWLIYRKLFHSLCLDWFDLIFHSTHTNEANCTRTNQWRKIHLKWHTNFAMSCLLWMHSYFQEYSFFSIFLNNNRSKLITFCSNQCYDRCILFLPSVKSFFNANNSSVVYFHLIEYSVNKSTSSKRIIMKSVSCCAKNCHVISHHYIELTFNHSQIFCFSIIQFYRQSKNGTEKQKRNEIIKNCATIWFQPILVKREWK